MDYENYYIKQHKKVIGSCAKGIDFELCGTFSCPNFNKYELAYMGCPYYRKPYELRGYVKPLHEVEGKRQRRLRVNWINYFLLGYILTYCIYSLIKGTPIDGTRMMNLAFAFGTFVIITILNYRSFGSYSCVFTKDNIYTEAMMLPWSDVISATYKVDFGNSFLKLPFCGIQLETKQGKMSLPHCSLFCFFSLKRYQKNIRFKWGSLIWSILIIILICVLVCVKF
ncbi:hypothetical protein RBG61_05590 [Paludicola sp. MB14-C6]|uniref:hypothetical protein n=1 Tax=Paludihabitans sp. MB14-C6 TaxID=3070656 RepID=UPI0027DC077B|nr:hypothetical protein [Paludicola sp. MB14-C6]WMJ24137.1 hypothetical protein RBG61_05590 [Paludicola sp. MB14-C6]